MHDYSTLPVSQALKDYHNSRMLGVDGQLSTSHLSMSIDRFGRSDLHFAADLNYVEGAKYLVEQGANILLRDSLQRTPLQIVRERHPGGKLDQYFSEYIKANNIPR